VTAFVKRTASAPADFFRCEAAGLRWLGAAGGVPCARVIDHGPAHLTLDRLTSVAPSPTAATEFGRRLAITHDAGAAAFGAGPDGYDGPGFFGPLSQPLAMSLRGHSSWGSFYAGERLGPMADRAGIDVGRVVQRCAAGDFDDDDPPARLHGDLWSGNVLWTPDGVVLIDPAAHGGHRETDLAMLALFGCPHYDDVIAGYQQVHPLTAGWQRRQRLHQLYPLLAHVVLFGGGYRRQAQAVAAEYR
jgi:fructosamine-3-kinase